MSDKSSFIFFNLSSSAHIGYYSGAMTFFVLFWLSDFWSSYNISYFPSKTNGSMILHVKCYMKIKLIFNTHAWCYVSK
jgi:hypothetical protein